MKKKFPIQNDAACMYKWTWSTLFLSRGKTSSCHRGRHWEFDVDTMKDFHNHPGKIGDREKMLKGEWPGNGCEYCRDVEAAGGVSDRTGYVNDAIELLPPEFETQEAPLSVTPKLLEIYFNNVCNQSCTYCTPGFSSQIEQEVRKFGPSEFSFDYSHWVPDTNYQLYKEKFWEWMRENGNKLEILHVLGGEPLYIKEFEECLDFFDKNPCPNLTWRVFSNLKHDSDKFKEKIERIQDLILEGKLKRIDFICSMDCWGPEIEYVRDGVILEQWEKNMNILLDHDMVGITIHATLTALTLVTFYQLMEKAMEWRKRHDLNVSWNTVQRPECWTPYHFGSTLLPFIDKALAVLTEAGEREENIIHLNGIRKQLESSTIDKGGVNRLVGFLDDIDKRRNRDWRKIFPDIVRIVDEINNDK